MMDLRRGRGRPRKNWEIRLDMIHLQLTNNPREEIIYWFSYQYCHYYTNIILFFNLVLSFLQYFHHSGYPWFSLKPSIENDSLESRIIRKQSFFYPTKTGVRLAYTLPSPNFPYGTTLGMFCNNEKIAISKKHSLARMK